MKNLKLNAIGVTELNQQEMRETQGGCCICNCCSWLLNLCKPKNNNTSNTGNGGEP